jgi:hypothetical protein
MLSATGGIFALLLHSLFQNTDKPPAFTFAVRPALRNLNNITHTCLVMFVVNAEFGFAFNELAVLWMFNPVNNGDPDTFVAALACYHAANSFSNLHF